VIILLLLLPALLNPPQQNHLPRRVADHNVLFESDSHALISVAVRQSDATSNPMRSSLIKYNLNPDL